MSEFLIDEEGIKVYYDIKSFQKDLNRCILWHIEYPDKPIFYIRPHREDGPAIIWPDGACAYYIEGKRHNEDGPTIIFLNGAVYWYLNNIEYSFENWCKELNKSEEEINFLKLKWNIA